MRHMENLKRVIFARITAAKQGIAFLLGHWKTVLSLSAFNGWVFSMSWSGVFAPPDSLAMRQLASGLRRLLFALLFSAFFCCVPFGVRHSPRARALCL